MFICWHLPRDGVVDLEELKVGLFAKFGVAASDEELRSVISEVCTLIL